MRWLAVVMLALSASACSSSGSGGPAVPPTVAATPAATVDENARTACAQLAQARILHEAGKGEKPAGGYGASTSEMRALSAELRAQDLALKSTVPEVRQIAMGTGSVAALGSWCQSHHL